MRRQILIAVVAALAVVLLASLLLIRPKAAEVGDVRDDITQAERREQDLRASLRQLEQARREAPATQAQLAKFQLLLRPTPDLPTFIRQVQAAANADGIALNSIAPSPPSAFSSPTGGAISGVETISVNLQVVGGFFRLESFLARLEELQRVVEIRNLSLSATRDDATGETVLQATVTLTMYVVDPSARVTGGGRPRGTPRPTPSPTATASPGGSA